MKKQECNLVQHSDQMECKTCGQVWDMNDPSPPNCKQEAKNPTVFARISSIFKKAKTA